MKTIINDNCITVNTELIKNISHTGLNLGDWENLLITRKLGMTWCNENIKRITKAEAIKNGFHAPSDGLLLVGAGGLQLKPDTPANDKDEKPIKYITLSGKGKDAKWDASLPLSPDLKERFWTDPDELRKHCIVIDGIHHILITEGFFKAIAGCSNGIATISLPGVEMWGKRQSESGPKELLPILEHYASLGFGFIIAYDADAASNKNVQSAVLKTAKALTMKGSPVRTVTGDWKVTEGKGMDDYIQKNGADKFKEILQRAKVVANLNKLYNDSPSEVKEGDETGKISNETKLASIIASKHKHEFLFDDEIGRWKHYRGDGVGKWEILTDVGSDAVLLEIIENTIDKGFGYSYLASVKKILAAKLIIREWNEAKPNKFLPHKNGVLEIATGQLLPHSSRYRFTWCLPRDYDPFAVGYPTIEKWMNEALGGDKKLINILLCFMVAVLKGRHELEKYLHLIGDGGNGKGTCIGLIQALIGDNNVHSSRMDLWCGNQFESANGLNKRLIAFWDEDKFAGKIGNFKSLVSITDRIRLERKSKDSRTYKYDGLVVVASNYPIFFGENSSALNRRSIVLPFKHKPLEADTSLPDKFALELSAFTNYLLSIPDDLVTATLKGAGKNSVVQSQKWDDSIHTESMCWWLNEFVIKDVAATVPIGDDKNEIKIHDGVEANIKTLFGSYCHRCTKAGRVPVGITEFSRRMFDVINNILKWDGVEKKRTSSGMFIKGLRLRRADESIDDFPTVDEIIKNKGDTDSTYPALPLFGSTPNHPTTPSVDATTNHLPVNEPTQPTEPPPPQNQSDVVNVGLDAGLNVGLDVGLDVGLKPLPSKDNVGCVGLTPIASNNNTSNDSITPKGQSKPTQLATQTPRKINVNSIVKIKDKANRYPGTYKVVGGDGSKWQVEPMDIKIKSNADFSTFTTNQLILIE